MQLLIKRTTHDKSISPPDNNKGNTGSEIMKTNKHNVHLNKKNFKFKEKRKNIFLIGNI